MGPNTNQPRQSGSIDGMITGKPVGDITTPSTPKPQPAQILTPTTTQPTQATTQPQATQQPILQQKSNTSENTTNPGKSEGIVSFILCLLSFDLVSLVLAFISGSKSKKSGHKMSGFAKASLIITIIKIVVIGVFAILTLTGVVKFDAFDNIKFEV